MHAAVVAGEQPGHGAAAGARAVYTAGKRTEPQERPFDGTPVIDVDRGGKITWHGPGQLVGYPIVRLPDPVDVVAYVRRLEEMMIRVCADFGLAATRVEGRSGVWVRRRRPTGPDRKIGAIGIRVSRDVTMHGFALNCDCRPVLGAGHRPLRHRRRRRHLAEPGARPRRDRRRGAALRREAPGRHPRLMLRASAHLPVRRAATLCPRRGRLGCRAGATTGARPDERTIGRARDLHARAAQDLPQPQGPARGRAGPRPRRPGGRRARVPGAQRLGQDHVDPDAARAGPRRRRHRCTSSAPRCRGGLPEVVGRVGAIVEEPKFFPAFSGRENLVLLADAIGAPRTRVDEVLEETALGERGKDRFRSLLPRHEAAPGDRRHLAEDPDLLIFDEPTNGLDPAGIREIRTTMRSLGATRARRCWSAATSSARSSRSPTPSRSSATGGCSPRGRSRR